MPQWIPVAEASGFADGEARECVAGGRVLAVFLVEGRPYVLDGVCPHQGGPLGKGRLEGCVVTCPWHGWQFDVRDGSHQVNSSLRHATLAARVREGWIEVDLGES